MAQSASEFADPAVIVVNPQDTVTVEAFTTWLDEREANEAARPGVTAAETLHEERGTGEV